MNTVIHKETKMNVYHDWSAGPRCCPCGARYDALQWLDLRPFRHDIRWCSCGLLLIEVNPTAIDVARCAKEQMARLATIICAARAALGCEVVS